MEPQKLHAEEPVSTISHCSSRQHSWRNLAHLVEHTMSPRSAATRWPPWPGFVACGPTWLVWLKAREAGCIQDPSGIGPRNQELIAALPRTLQECLEHRMSECEGFQYWESVATLRAAWRGDQSPKSGILEARNSPLQPPKPDHTCTCSCDIPALLLRAHLKGTKHQSNEPGGCMAETRVA